MMTGIAGMIGFYNVERAIKKIDDFPQQHLVPASEYLTGIVMEVLNEIIPTALQIQVILSIFKMHFKDLYLKNISFQSWLKKCTNDLAFFLNVPIQWETPMGLKVVQPYAKVKDTEYMYTFLWDDPYLR